MVSKPATVPQGRSSNGFGKRIAVVMLGALALAGVAGSPVSALPRTGVALPGGGRVLAPPDPCLPQPQILSFTATPSPVTLGDDVTLNWNVQVPSGCNYLVALLGQSVAPQGSFQVQPSFTTSYTLTLSWGPTRTLWTTATTTVSVDLPADPQDPTRKLVRIPAQQMVPLFVQALKTPNTTVVINADLDLSGLNPIVISDGVRMVGWRTAVPGQPYLAGPRLSTTSFTDPLFSIQGDNVRITGVRLEGPYMQANTRGIQSSSQVNIEIDHNEIYGWSAVAVDVLDPKGRIVVPAWVDHRATPAQLVYALTTEPVWIHDNYIHDNYVGDPYFGYGVAVGDNAHALIERNVFNWHYHAIAGDGSLDAGYRAYRNLILADNDGNEQTFDMHGLGCHSQCGYAGRDVTIRYNSFLFTGGPDINVRGTPAYGAVVESNVFAYGSLSDAVTTSGTGIYPMTTCLGALPSSSCGPLDNKVGVTTWEQTDSCDFDGDGINDTFIATGQTLWYRSGDTTKGPTPWVYLNMSPKHLNELSLGYFSGRHVCDVVDSGWISVGGSGPWLPQTPLGPGRGGVRPIAPSAGVSQ